MILILGQNRRFSDNSFPVVEVTTSAAADIPVEQVLTTSLPSTSLPSVQLPRYVDITLTRMNFSLSGAGGGWYLCQGDPKGSDPPGNRMTDAGKTLPGPKLRLRAVKILLTLKVRAE